MLSPEEFVVEVENVREGWRIEYEPLEDFDSDSGEDWQATLYEVNSPLRAQIAGRMGRNFHQELHYDSPPYSAGNFGDEYRHVYLIRARDILRLVPVIAGAVEIRMVKGTPVLMWVWIHPFQRGARWETWSLVWSALSEKYGELFLQAPLTHAMRAFADKIGVPAERRVVLN